MYTAIYSSLFTNQEQRGTTWVVDALNHGATETASKLPGHLEMRGYSSQWIEHGEQHLCGRS